MATHRDKAQQQQEEGLRAENVAPATPRRGTAGSRCHTRHIRHVCWWHSAVGEERGWVARGVFHAPPPLGSDLACMVPLQVYRSTTAKCQEGVPYACRDTVGLLLLHANFLLCPPLHPPRARKGLPARAAAHPGNPRRMSRQMQPPSTIMQATCARVGHWAWVAWLCVHACMFGCLRLQVRKLAYVLWVERRVAAQHPCGECMHALHPDANINHHHFSD